MTFYEEVLANLVFLLLARFKISSECTKDFTYVGTEAHKNHDKTILTVNQNSFTASFHPIEISKERSLDKATSVTDDERTKLKSEHRQLDWLSGISCPEISFDV